MRFSGRHFSCFSFPLFLAVLAADMSLSPGRGQEIESGSTKGNA